MFHNKKTENNISVPEEIANRYDIKSDKDDTFFKHIETATSAYCPIIFIDQKEIMPWDESNTTDALTLLTMNTIKSVYDNNLKSLPYNYLYGLEDSAHLTVTTIIERIKEETLMSVMSFLDNIDSITDNLFLKYFNIREKIDSCFRPYNSVNQCVWNFFNSDPYSLDKMKETDIELTKEYRAICARTIMGAVIHELNLAINYAIDDATFRIHLIPNIMELKDHIIKQYHVPKEDTDDSRFWILANISIKDGLSAAFNESLYPIIMQNIYNILDSAVGSSYYVYRDAIIAKNDDAREDQENNK